MAQVLVRDVDRKVLENLKKRARAHGRSLEAELRDILERASRVDMSRARGLAQRIRKKLAGRKHTDSAELLADDRTR